ncbi:hypothetical protein V7119_17090, partial [Bacillus toyonensis]|uniref:hypothetical protein n=1 Tax=Bacillus toyonensis TaxID=155322 RepID=UPI002FFF73CF
LKRFYWSYYVRVLINNFIYNLRLNKILLTVEKIKLLNLAWKVNDGEMKNEIDSIAEQKSIWKN